MDVGIEDDKVVKEIVSLVVTCVVDKGCSEGVGRRDGGGVSVGDSILLRQEIYKFWELLTERVGLKILGDD